jgi:hypothetical protein
MPSGHQSKSTTPFPWSVKGSKLKPWSPCTTLQAQDSIDSFLAFAVSWCEATAAASQVTLSSPSCNQSRPPRTCSCGLQCCVDIGTSRNPCAHVPQLVAEHEGSGMLGSCCKCSCFDNRSQLKYQLRRHRRSRSRAASFRQQSRQTRLSMTPPHCQTPQVCSQMLQWCTV